MAMANQSALVGKAKADFFKNLFGGIQEYASIDGSIVKCISLGNNNNLLFTDTLVIRPCYEHLLPHIHNALTLKDPEPKDYYTGAVTGTPGIGNTAFGLYLLRHFVKDHHKTVIYWHSDNIFLFTLDEDDKAYFNLSQKLTEIDSKTLYCGSWDGDATSNDWSFLRRVPEERDMIILHDPVEGDTRLSQSRLDIPRLLFILSHGNSLISRWNTKGCRDINFFYMPTWTQQEALLCLKYLPVQTDGNKSSKENAEDLYYRYGGCIRGWVEGDKLWVGMESKIQEVVTNSGTNVLKRTTHTRGSIIHLEVEFDQGKDILGLKTAASTINEDDDDDDDEKHNSFKSYQHVLGSEKIMDLFRELLQQKGEGALQVCLSTWAGQSGFECVYGGMFEHFCHRKLQGNTGMLRLRMRIVYKESKDNNENIYKVVIPKFHQGTCRYTSNDPSFLGEAHVEGVNECKYFWPISSNHPTYDSAVVVSSESLGLGNVNSITKEPGLDKLEASQSVALLLQMTVSGATGLPRRPEHSVKQHIRKKFEGVFKKRIPGFEKSGFAVTTFLVPTECFMPFLFQLEETMEGKISDKQPDFQLVFEVPKIFRYKKASARGSTHAVVSSDFKKRKIVHKFDPTKISDETAVEQMEM